MKEAILALEKTTVYDHSLNKMTVMVCKIQSAQTGIYMKNCVKMEQLRFIFVSKSHQSPQDNQMNPCEQRLGDGGKEKLPFTTRREGQPSAPPVKGKRRRQDKRH